MSFDTRSGGYREPSRDRNALVYEALRVANQSFAAPEFMAEEQHTKAFGSGKSRSKISLDRFEFNVRLVLGYISKDWIDKDNNQQLELLKEWAKIYTNWKPAHDRWQKDHDAWVQDPVKDPMEEPIEPLIEEKPKPFLNQVKECWDENAKCYQAFKLHNAILRLLDRVNFWEKETEPEEFGSTEYPDEQLPEKSPAGSAIGPPTDTASTKPLSQQ